MPDYMPDSGLEGLVGNVLSEAHRPRSKKPDVSLSRKQIDAHYDDLYLGYIKKLNEIERKLKTADHRSANQTFGEFRELKKEALFTLNAVRLHEGYFDNLKPAKRPDYIDRLLTKDFGKASRWEDEFIACGLSARGWAILGYDRLNNKLINVILDAHDAGAWRIEPIIILDMYEHSFMIDFGTNRGKYIEFFMDNIDWERAASRLADADGSNENNDE